MDSGRQKVAAQFAWISVSNISIFFYNILLCNCLSYGQNELERRETIFMLTHIPGRRKTFVLSKYFLHLYPSIHLHVKIIKQVMKNIFFKPKSEVKVQSSKRTWADTKITLLSFSALSSLLIS